MMRSGATPGHGSVQLRFTGYSRPFRSSKWSLVPIRLLPFEDTYPSLYRLQAPICELSSNS